ncbi:MAG: hypothetical protein ACK5YR_04920 [Pirellula sp.]|jgi:hypothetical protein
MKVLSLASQPGEPRYCQSLQVNYWFWERGYEVIPFARDALLSGSLDHYLHDEREDTIVYGAMLVAYSFRRQLLEAQVKIESIQRELDQSRPISFWSVKHQIRMATQDIAPSEVASVHYNSLRDRYTVQFGWTDSSTKKLIGTAINFEPDGQGRYVGQLLSEPFAKYTLDPDGDRICTPFEIIVKDDVSLGNDLAKQHGIKEYKIEHWRTK